MNEQNQTHPWCGDQLVVASSHLEVVLDELEEWAARSDWELDVRRQESDSRLGLTLLEFDMAGPAAYVSTELPDALQRLRPSSETPAAVEIIGAGLRFSLARRWSGWEPVLGKNRMMDHVGGLRVIGINGGTGGSAQVRPDRVIGINGVRLERVIGINGEPEAAPSGGQSFGPRQTGSGSPATIAVVDTGVLPHPWLAGAYRCDPDDVLAEDEIGDLSSAHHGTFVAGLVLHEAPASSLWIERALPASGLQESWELAKQLGRLAERGVDIVNLSLGCQTEDNQPPLVLQRAIECLGSQTVVIASAGNYAYEPDDTPQAPPSPTWPAAFETVVAVGSVDVAGGKPSPFSPDAPWIDVREPGERVVSTYGGTDGSFRTWSGTSFSSATFAGILARSMRRGETAPQAWRRIRTERDR